MKKKGGRKNQADVFEVLPKTELNRMFLYDNRGRLYRNVRVYKLPSVKLPGCFYTISTRFRTVSSDQTLLKETFPECRNFLFFLGKAETQIKAKK